MREDSSTSSNVKKEKENMIEAEATIVTEGEDPYVIKITNIQEKLTATFNLILRFILYIAMLAWFILVIAKFIIADFRLTFQ